jgi:disulfide bond formation protein DsbB
MATALEQRGGNAAVLTPRTACLILLLGSGALLLGALGFQYLGGLAPCPLCVWQRVAHGAVIGLAGLALWRLPIRLGLTLATLAMFAGAATAGYHLGVEQGWVGSACDGGVGATTVEDLRSQIMAQSGPACSQVAWAFLGISMAGWNGVISLALAGAGFLALLRNRAAA